MAKARKPPPPRAIPTHYPTGGAEIASTGSDRFRVEIDCPDGPHAFATARWAIRDRYTGHLDVRPGMLKSGVHDEVARLNAGIAVSKVSQGKGRRPRKTTEAVRWVEFLMELPETRALLQDAMDNRRKFGPADVLAVMTYRDDESGLDLRRHGPFRLPTYRPLPAEPTKNSRIENLKKKKSMEAERAAADARRLALSAEAERKLIDAVGVQLRRVLGIQRTNWRDSKKAKR